MTGFFNPFASGAGGGGSIMIDTQVNGTSTNAVQNKAIYNFVNSSVATNTANFINTFNSVEELEAYTGTVTNNDYAFVIGTDSDGNTIYNRYKYNGSAWVFEYTLNNSSFTAAQWATIQSGLTASDKEKLDGIEAGANKTVVDANLSQTSTNPVQNKTVNSALAAKQDTITDLATIRSGAAAGATAVQPAEFEADQQRQETEIGAVAALGAKNLLKITASSGVLNTATIDIADDGSIHISGRPTGNGAYVISSGIELIIPKNAYILSMGAKAGNTKISISLRRTGTSQYVDLYRAESRIIPAGTYDRAHIYLYSDTAYDTTVYPMIRPASITDSTFVPYAKTNRELTVAEDEDRAALIAQVDGGAKNALKNTAPYGELVRTNITFTHNSDDTYLVNAENPNADVTDLYVAANISLEPGNYILTGCPAGGNNSSTYKLHLTGIGYDIGDGFRFTIAQTTTVSVYIRIWAGYVPNGLVFKPMICQVADYAISPAFVQYAPNNRELYETGQSCYDFIFGVGTALQSYDDLNNYKNPGKVQAANGAIAATIANTPWTQSGFTAITIPNLTLTSCMQFVLPNTMAGKWYRRRYMQDTWSPWTEYDGTQVTTT